jgi:hypothetical protein
MLPDGAFAEAVHVSLPETAQICVINGVVPPPPPNPAAGTTITFHAAELDDAAPTVTVKPETVQPAAIGDAETLSVAVQIGEVTEVERVAVQVVLEDIVQVVAATDVPDDELWPEVWSACHCVAEFASIVIE